MKAAPARTPEELRAEARRLIAASKNSLTRELKLECAERAFALAQEAEQRARSRPISAMAHLRKQALRCAELVRRTLPEGIARAFNPGKEVRSRRGRDRGT